MVCRAAPAAGRPCQQTLGAVLGFEGFCQFVLAAVLGFCAGPDMGQTSGGSGGLWWGQQRGEGSNAVQHYAWPGDRQLSASLPTALDVRSLAVQPTGGLCWHALAVRSVAETVLRSGRSHGTHLQAQLLCLCSWWAKLVPVSSSWGTSDSQQTAVDLQQHGPRGGADTDSQQGSQGQRYQAELCPADCTLL